MLNIHARRRCNASENRGRRSASVLDIRGKKTQLRGLLETGGVLSVIPIETWKKMGFDKDDLIDSRIRLSAANKGAIHQVL